MTDFEFKKEDFELYKEDGDYAKMAEVANAKLKEWLDKAPPACGTGTSPTSVWTVCAPGCKIPHYPHAKLVCIEEIK